MRFKCWCFVVAWDGQQLMELLFDSDTCFGGSRSNWSMIGGVLAEEYLCARRLADAVKRIGTSFLKHTVTCS
jgi:hypothetical protein